MNLLGFAASCWELLVDVVAVDNIASVDDDRSIVRPLYDDRSVAFACRRTHFYLTKQCSLLHTTKHNNKQTTHNNNKTKNTQTIKHFSKKHNGC
jgi:hypothetical protein